MNIKTIVLLYLTLSTVCSAELFEHPHRAFICVPVADLIGQPINTFKIDNDTTTAYQKMPISWGPNTSDKFYCPRIYQGLMHEAVALLGYEDDEAIVAIFNMFYLNDEHPQEPQVVYYTLKSNIIDVDEELAKHRSPIVLPQPISFAQVAHKKPTNIVTLTLPYHDPITEQTYSAGTRFVATGSLAQSYEVWTYDMLEKTFRHTTLPLNICMPSTDTTKQTQINNFVGLLHLWTNLPDGFIPLVWGGCSFNNVCATDTYTAQTTTYTDGSPVTYWNREGTQSPFSGFDTSALIARAAQICGIPYYFRNTYTAEKCLRTLGPNEPICAGDLIWFPGYLTAITSLENATVVGAIAYSAGYGKVFEAPINTVVSNIHTIDELRDAYINQTPLELVDAQGNKLRTIDTFKILKLESAWDFAEHAMLGV